MPVKINVQHHGNLLEEISNEINRGNEKHGHAPLANADDVVLILAEEVGEFAQAVLKDNYSEARLELIQIAAVAINHLLGTGPHQSKL